MVPNHSYALAASKHAPQTNTQQQATVFKPVPHKKQPTPTSASAPTLVRSQNPVTIVQSTMGGIKLTNLSYPALITKTNIQLQTSGVKENTSDLKTIQVGLVHQHPSNDLVLYTTTAKQAEALRATSQRWLPQITQKMSLRNPVYPVVVHGIPTSFKPDCPDDIKILIAMNPDTLNPPPLFVKWVSQQAIKRGVLLSLIRIGLYSIEQAKKQLKA